MAGWFHRKKVFLPRAVVSILSPMKPIRLITVAPGHFHAALVQKRMAPGVARRSYVYAPLDADTVAHLDRIAGFNARPDDPTAWEVDVRAGADYLDRFAREQPGNVVVLSGRNRPKIDLMRAAVGCALHVVADKPWVVEAADLPKLDEVLRDAELRDVLVWDVMTERHEVTNRLMRELVCDPAVFGQWLVGSPETPGLYLESVHSLKKLVAGRPLRRPWWWFDPGISGEAMADVGTHLADLALWMISPERVVAPAADIRLLDADRWPLLLTEEQFRELTGLPAFPPDLAPRVVEGNLYYAGNNSAAVTLRGVHVKLVARWEYHTPGDTHFAAARGTKATVAIRQEPGAVPEVFVTATNSADHPALVQQLRAKCEGLQHPLRGIGVTDRGADVQLLVPAELRIGHEAHFHEVMEEFARYFHTPRAVPPWERPNAVAKYQITTRAVELARRKRPGV